MGFLNNLINGISLGSIYAVIALGYTLVYGIAKMLNFAHGDVIMVGGYVIFTCMTTWGLNSWLSIVLAVIACTLLGIVIEKVAYKPLRQATSLAVLITAIGVSYFLQNIALLIFGEKPVNFTSVVIVPSIKLFDGHNDAIATTVVLLGALITRVTSVNLDGVLGLAVAVFIVVSGVKLIMETGDPLLGVAPDAELVKKIYEKILSYEGIFGIHDLTVHNYGEGKCFASVHCEVPAERDILISHDIIDNIERDFETELGIHLVIHLDPVVTEDERTNKLREQVRSLLRAVVPGASMHDFRVVWGVTHSNIVFDVAVPFSLQESDQQLKARIDQAVRSLDPSYRTVLTIDRESTVNELES